MSNHPYFCSRCDEKCEVKYTRGYGNREYIVCAKCGNAMGYKVIKEEKQMSKEQEMPNNWIRPILDAFEEKVKETERAVVAPALEAGDKLWEAINEDNNYNLACNKVGVAMDRFVQELRRYNYLTTGSYEGRKKP